MSAPSVAATNVGLFEALGPLATALAEAVKQQICLPDISHVYDQPYDHALGTAIEQAAVLTIAAQLRATTPQGLRLREAFAALLELPIPVVEPVVVDEPVWECELVPEPEPEPEYPKLQPEDWLNMSTAAHLLGLSVPYVRMLCRVGKLGAFSAGDEDWFVQRFAIQAFLDSAEQRRSRGPRRRQRRTMAVSASATAPAGQVATGEAAAPAG